MRTRHILAALALPAMFVACTNDEFEQVQSPVGENPMLKGRAKGQVTLIADKGKATTGADTRVVGSMAPNGGINWLWEGPADKLGAVVVDYADANNTIVDLANYPHYAITNYPFEPRIDGPSASADFSTPTAVVSGAYMFYNKYDGNNTQRRVIGHEIARLTTVSEGTEAGLTQVGTNKEAGGQNFFVSPIIDLAIADGSDIAKPVSLTSVYSILRFNFKTDLVGDYYNRGFKINKIVLKTLGKDASGNKDQFMRKLTLDPSKLAKLQQDLGKKHPGLFKANGAIDAMNLSDEKVREALGLVNAEIANPDNSIGKVAEGTEDLVYQLKEPIVFKSKEESKDVMVVLPAGTYHRATGLKLYDGQTAGVLQMTVYTSEGTYDTYLINNGDKTFERGKMYSISRPLIIDGGKTNINLFDPNKGFNIETTADYNYVIEYIKDHFRDFGNTSNWKTPVLNFVKGAEIEVDDAHYFPGFPVKYLGNATLQLTGENQTYSFQPKNVILGEDENKEGRPTIEVMEESTTMLFEEDVKAGEGTDGETITAAVKLISNGKVEVAGGKTVNFELLTSNRQLEINKGAVVNASGAVKTAGIVNLKEGAKLTASSTFDNAAAMTIEAKAIATLKKAATNEGDITVKGLGKLVSSSTFTNNAEGTILVESCDLQYMNSKDRAEASFATLSNKGEITIQKSVDKKGTYGGLMSVKTLTNSGEISNDGELKITKVTNSGTITLESDPYALLKIEGGAATDTKGNGSIVLADATQYEMFDSYYTGRSDLEKVTGVIETTLDQEAYDAVMANNTEYSGQETAWKVLNQITVDGALELKAGMAGKNKKFILPENASINALENLEVSALVVKGAGAALTGKPIIVDGNGSTVPGAGLVDIRKGAELTNNVALTIGQGTTVATTTLNVAGKLVNKGSIDTTDGEGGDAVEPFKGVNRVMAMVSGELVNEGKLSKKAVAKYSGVGYNQVQKLISGLKVSNIEWKGTWGNLQPRVDVIDANSIEDLQSQIWNENWNSKTDIKVSETILKKIMNPAYGKLVKVQGFQAIACQKVKGSYYVLYLGGDKNEEPANANFEAARKDVSLIATAINIAKGEKMPYPTKTWFYIKENTGIVDLLKAADDKNSWAFGEIFDNSRGTKKGKFNNEMEK